MKIKLFELEEKMFLFGYTCVLVAFLLQISNIPNVFDGLYSVMRNLRIIGYTLCILKIIIGNTFTVRNVLKFLVVTILIIMATVQSGLIVLLTDILFVIACKKIELVKVIKLDLRIRCVFLLITILTCLLGIVPDILDYRSGALSRHSLGFAHPNRLALHIFMICVYYLYIYYDRIRIKHIVIISAMGLFTLLASDSRTSSIGIFIILALAVLNRYEVKKGYKKYIEQHIRGISIGIVVFSLAFSILAPLLFLMGIYPVDNNDTFGIRIFMSNQAILNYGITLFGQKINFVTSIASRLIGQSANGIDNVYVYVLINYGLVVFGLFIFLIVVGLRQSIRMKDYIGVMCFLILITIGIMENQVLNIESNLFLLYIGKAWNERTIKKKTVKYKYDSVEESNI